MDGMTFFSAVWATLLLFSLHHSDGSEDSDHFARHKCHTTSKKRVSTFILTVPKKTFSACPWLPKFKPYTNNLHYGSAIDFFLRYSYYMILVICWYFLIVFVRKACGGFSLRFNTMAKLAFYERSDSKAEKTTKKETMVGSGMRAASLKIDCDYIIVK